MRSKSELLIAEALLASGVTFAYEKPLSLGGATRHPDFTIEDEISGRVVYWEHLGMLEREDYRASWAKKLGWYRTNGIMPAEETKAGSPLLVTTADTSQSGLDMQRIKAIISDFCI